MCKRCFQQMKEAAGPERPRCAVCREPASRAEPMPAVQSVIKENDPVAFNERKLSEKQAAEAALDAKYAAKFEKRIKNHPMLQQAVLRQPPAAAPAVVTA